jgi:Phage terminase large subunit (GpA)
MVAQKKYANAQEAYEARKKRERERQAAQTRDGTDIGDIPKVNDEKLKKQVSKSFLKFCLKCFPARFKDPFSADHLEVIATIQRCIIEGQLYAFAMPRGSGKTTIIEAAALWAILTGRKRYVVLIAANAKEAKKILTSIKSELEENDKLYGLFPEVCHAIRALEGKANKCTGQTCAGKRTHMQWNGPRVVFPTITDSKSSSAVIETCGLTAGIRGMKHTRVTDGEIARPDLFVVDDPQTDKSAKSLTQVQQRVGLINGAVMGLAGPNTEIAGFATVTVIEKDDVADQLLDRERFPDWQGKRYKLVYEWPKNKELWEQYGTLRAEGLRVDGSIQRATEFYVQHRKEMDLGSRVGWSARKKTDISAIQHAFNLRLKSPDTFDAEFQNTPRTDESSLELLTPIAIENKLHGFGRGVLPPEANLVTGFVDVQQKLLYWSMVAWNTDSFTGWLLDYGVWPSQTANYFTLRKVEKTLATIYPRMHLAARLRSGLFDLIDRMSSTTFHGPQIAAKVGVDTVRPNSLRAQMIGIDAAWGPSTRTVQSVCLEHPKAAWLLPFFGRSIDAQSRPMAEWMKKAGERKGNNWILRPTEGGGHHAIADVNHWKSFLHAGLNTPLGDNGSISLFRPELRTGHTMFAEHLRAENPISVTAGGRTIEKWVLPPNKPDNHFLDCFSGCGIMASILGANLESDSKRKVVRRRPQRRPTKLLA